MRFLSLILLFGLLASSLAIQCYETVSGSDEPVVVDCGLSTSCASSLNKTSGVSMYSWLVVFYRVLKKRFFYKVRQKFLKFFKVLKILYRVNKNKVQILQHWTPIDVWSPLYFWSPCMILRKFEIFTIYYKNKRS